MKLYYTPHSPFSRMARMTVIEAGLESRVEQEVAQTRVVDSPYYKINPSGRVPYLLRDDGVGFEESELVIACLDHMAGTTFAAVPDGEAGWEYRRLNAIARSLCDAASVWFREILRAEEDRSATILAHEIERCRRLTDVWEQEIGHPVMQGAINLPQITLACALGLEAWVDDFRWRDGRPGLSAWMDRMMARPSMIATARQDNG